MVYGPDMADRVGVAVTGAAATVRTTTDLTSSSAAKIRDAEAAAQR